MMRFLPLVAAASMALALLLIRAGLLSPLGGFGIFVLAWGVAAVSGLVVGLLVLRGGEHRAVATADLVVGLALSVALALSARGASAPPIHDITTSPDDPPEFVAAATAADNADRDLAYPEGHPDTAELQRRAYPEVAPIPLPAPPEEAYDAVLHAAAELGWELTWANAAGGHAEFTDTTGVFRFVDDVVVRVRPDGSDGSIVDVRSLSRVGRSDLGKNAQRIARFTELFQAGGRRP